MKNYLLDWAYSPTRKQRVQILEDMLITQMHLQDGIIFLQSDHMLLLLD